MRLNRRRGLTVLASLSVGLGSLVMLAAPAQAGNPSELVVNEAESNGPSDFIELANPTATATDVSGLVLKDNDDSRTLSIPPATSIPAGGHLAVEVDVPGGFALGASDSARLFFPDGVTLIDGFSWTAHAAGTWSRCPSGTRGTVFDATPTMGTANACVLTIAGTAASSSPRNAAGWYADPVTVSFACTPGNAPIVGACPGPATLATSGADQSVTRTVSDTSGASATATITNIDIDLDAPTVKIKGVKKGKTYPGKKKPKCRASDTHSGLASCKLKQKKKGSKYIVTATATDNAGNVTTVTLTYKVKKKT
jgi:hypothetical protein